MSDAETHSPAPRRRRSSGALEKFVVIHFCTLLVFTSWGFGGQAMRRRRFSRPPMSRWIGDCDVPDAGRVIPVQVRQAGGFGRGNVCRDNRGDGIRLEDAAAPLLSENEARLNDGYGISIARRAGLTAEDVLNAKPLADLELWLAARRTRRASIES